MKHLLMTVLVALASAQVSAAEQYFCQTVDGKIQARLQLADQIEKRPKSAEVCTGGYYGDSEQTCYKDNYVEEARTASIEISDQFAQSTFVQLEVYRYIRDKQPPRLTFFGRTDVRVSAFTHVNVSESLERYVLFVSKGMRSVLLRCHG